MRKIRRYVRAAVVAALPLVPACTHDPLPGSGDGPRFSDGSSPPVADGSMPPVTDGLCMPVPVDGAINPVEWWHAIDGRYPLDLGYQFGPPCAPLCGVMNNPGIACHPVGYDCAQTVFDCVVQRTGRRPSGLADAGVVDGDAVGRYLAQAAHLEAASVVAFERLAMELASLGAPPSLSRWARRAAEEERRHARAMEGLARRRGATPPPVEVAPFRERGLVELAIENAIEGMVGETYGAAFTEWQSRRAGDPALRRAAGTIAVEEAGHAELAFAIDAWAGKQLSSCERGRIADARTAAGRALVAQANMAVDAALVEIAGVPPPACALALARAAVALA